MATGDLVFQGNLALPPFKSNAPQYARQEISLDVPSFLFPAKQQSELRLVGVMDTRWDNSSNLVVNLALQAADVASGNAVFEASIQRKSNTADTNTDSFGTAVTSTVSISGSGILNATISLSKAQAGISPKDQFVLRIRRVGDSVSDTCGGSIYVRNVHIAQA